MLKKLNKMNPTLEILPIESSHLKQYGQILKNYDFKDMFPISRELVDMDGTTYIADIEKLHQCKSSELLKNQIFGEMTLQLGLCFGENRKMNGMEYHKSSEVVIAVTDVILILGDIRDIKNNSWDSSKAQCFFLPQGKAVELYGGTLHFAPCRVSSEPFCSIIVLPEGTNLPLKEVKIKNEPLLFKNNKWLICHKDSPAADNGAFMGITGDNIQINI